MFQPLQQAGLRTWTSWRMHDGVLFPFGFEPDDCRARRAGGRQRSNTTRGMIRTTGGSPLRGAGGISGVAALAAEVRWTRQWPNGQRSLSADTAEADRDSTVVARVDLGRIPTHNAMVAGNPRD